MNHKLLLYHTDSVRKDFVVRHSHELYLDFQYIHLGMCIWQIRYSKLYIEYSVRTVMDCMVFVVVHTVSVVVFLQIVANRNKSVHDLQYGNHCLVHMDSDYIYHLEEL